MAICFDKPARALYAFAATLQDEIDQYNRLEPGHYILAHIAQTPDTCQAFLQCALCPMVCAVVAVCVGDEFLVQPFETCDEPGPVTDRWLSAAYRAAKDVR